MPRSAKVETTQMRYMAAENTARCTGPSAASAMWSAAAVDRDRLKQVARLIYDQTEKAEKKG